MSRHLLRAAAAGLVALLAGLLTAPSAWADNGEFFDVGGHITYVRITHGPATVGIYAQDNGIDIDAYHHFWIDTNSTNPGPEYKAEVYQRSRRAHLMRVANFDSSASSSVARVSGPRSAISTRATSRSSFPAAASAHRPGFGWRWSGTTTRPPTSRTGHRASGGSTPGSTAERSAAVALDPNPGSTAVGDDHKIDGGRSGGQHRAVEQGRLVRTSDESDAALAVAQLVDVAVAEPRPVVQQTRVPGVAVSR